MKLNLFAILMFLFIGILVTGCSDLETTDATGDVTERVSVKDCGDDFICFTQAAQDCTNAKVNYNIELDVFGILEEMDISYNLVRVSEEICSFSFVTNNINIEFSEEFIDTMTQYGTSQEELDKQIEEAKSQFEVIIGKEGVCEGDLTVIANIFASLEDAPGVAFDESDLDCSGEFFELASQNEGVEETS